jgi:hypothetical protein
MIETRIRRDTSGYLSVLSSPTLARGGQKKRHQFELSQVKLDSLNTSTPTVHSSYRTFRVEVFYISKNFLIIKVLAL